MKRIAHQTLGALVLGAITVLAMQGIAAAADYPPTPSPVNGTLTATVSDNGVVAVSGDGCGASTDVAIAFDDANVTSATTDAEGAFSAEFDVPSGTEAGTHTVVASNDSCELTTTVVVSAAGTGGALPRTGGSNTFTMALVALSAVVLGVGLVVFTRRRRTSMTSAS